MKWIKAEDIVSKPDNILNPITVEELITTVESNLDKGNITEESIKEEYRKIAEMYIDDAEYNLEQLMDYIIKRTKE